MKRIAVARSMVLAVLLAWAAGCTDTSGPGGNKPLVADSLPSLIVSGPVRGPGGVGSVTASAARASGSGSVAYVSLPPGSVPTGLAATIRDLATGLVVTTVVVDGGFDPVAIAASIGDTLVVEIARSGSGPIRGWEVVITRRPVVVRTDPPPRKRDVPLNSVLVVVFSEPMDSTTLTGSVQLWRDSTLVAGTVRFRDSTGIRAEFHPDELLSSQIEYLLVVNQTVRDLNGEPLASMVAVPFTTATIGALATITVSPDPVTLASNGTQRFTAVGRDTAGNVVAIAPAWSLAVGGGAIDNSGLFTAGGVAGVFVNTVTAASGSISGHATVTVVGQAGGPFAPTGNMITARAHHTATLLPNGKVLIVGGVNVGGEPLRSAEIYDPSTGSFSPAGDMATVVGEHTAVLLSDGRVLIAGGGRAELYDPSAGRFAVTGTPILSGAGWRGASTLLPDGRVLIAEDLNAEVYDPASGTFALTGPYAEPGPISVDAATLLPDGTVLVVGFSQAVDGVAELYDPRTGTFSRTGRRQASDVESTATLLMDGTVLLVEGNDSNLPDDVESYDPASRTFSHLGYASEVHEFSAAARLLDGTVLIAGGQIAGGSGNDAAERYVPATRTFVAAGNMIARRHSHTATLLPDGTVLIAGGFSDWDWPTPGPTSSAEIYRPVAGAPSSPER